MHAYALTWRCSKYIIKAEKMGVIAMKARKSVVRVLFESGINLTYYNDLFDLHYGDIVYVKGKLEG